MPRGIVKLKLVKEDANEKALREYWYPEGKFSEIRRAKLNELRRSLKIKIPLAALLYNDLKGLHAKERARLVERIGAHPRG